MREYAYSDNNNLITFNFQHLTFNCIVDTITL